MEHCWRRHGTTPVLNEHIRTIRVQAGLSLDKAARLTGLSKSVLSRLENGHSPVTATKLEAIAAAYGILPGDLLNGQIVKVPEDMDLDQLGQIVELVERTIQSQTTRPRPEKVRLAVIETLRLSRQDAARSGGAEFDPARYVGMIAAIIRE